MYVIIFKYIYLNIFLKTNSMNIANLKTALKTFLLVVIFLFSNNSFGQNQTIAPKQQDDFWKKVTFGGGLNLGISSGYTNIMVAPTAVYNVNSMLSLGAGLQVGYASQKNTYSSFVYGASLIGFLNPLLGIQLSAELEETSSSVNYQNNLIPNSNNVWNTALYLGAGYRTGKVTVGARYDVLNKNNKGYNASAFMPFIRFSF